MFWFLSTKRRANLVIFLNLNNPSLKISVFLWKTKPMKLIFLTFLLPLLSPLSIAAGNSDEEGLVIEGESSVQADIHSRSGILDSRRLIYLLPSRRDINAVGMDLNAVYGSRVMARGAGLGLRYRNSSLGKFTLSAALNADLFFAGGSDTHILLKQACVAIDVVFPEGTSAGAEVGYGLHPMARFGPKTLWYGSAAPFNPYGYAPGLSLWGDFLGHIRVDFSLLASGDYPPTGPEGASSAYRRYSHTPEFFLSTFFHAGPWRAGAGADLVMMNPRSRGIYPYTEIDVLVGERINAFAAFVAGEYSSRIGGMDLEIRLKGIFNRGCTHLNMFGGYFVSGIDEYGFERRYKPFNTLSAWADVSLGGALKGYAFGGYLRNVDYAGSVPYPEYVYFTSGLSDLSNAFRAGVGARYSWKRVGLWLEYNYTGARYASGYSMDNGVCISASFRF